MASEVVADPERRVCAITTTNTMRERKENLLRNA